MMRHATITTAREHSTVVLEGDMPIGDQQEAVEDCVDGVLIAHGAPSPINAMGAMDKTYHYAATNMYSFHAQVKDGLAAKSYTYTYPITATYMQQTVAMVVLDLYSKISTQTRPAKPVPSAPPGSPKPKSTGPNLIALKPSNKLSATT